MNAQQMIRQDLNELKKDLHTLSDELRLKVHLANMDLKSEWEKLEPQVERAWTDAARVTTEAAEDLKKKLLALRARLEQKS